MLDVKCKEKEKHNVVKSRQTPLSSPPWRNLCLGCLRAPHNDSLQWVLASRHVLQPPTPPSGLTWSIFSPFLSTLKPLYKHSSVIYEHAPCAYKEQEVWSRSLNGLCKCTVHLQLVAGNINVCFVHNNLLIVINRNLDGDTMPYRLYCINLYTVNYLQY